MTGKLVAGELTMSRRMIPEWVTSEQMTGK